MYKCEGAHGLVPCR